ncbi:hypothetical protein [Streptomyces sp. NPDC007172]|uniref:hypothetical protein n=1 Tax=Streptomyces sp. NPDC007172 TaxID=3364776 RepID=UPI0036985080
MSDEPIFGNSNLAKNITELSRLWFSQKDGDTVKQKINGLSVGLDYTKVALAGLALGVTPVKIDWTLVKVDEKGVSILGVTRKEWPWIRADTDFWKKAKDKLQGKKEKARGQAKKEEAKREAAQEVQAATENLRKDVGRAHRRIDRLERSAHSQRGRVNAVAGGSNVATGNPKNIKGAAQQIKELEGRLNSLAAALG